MEKDQAVEKKDFFLKTAFFFIFLLPLALVTGPLLPEIFSILLITIFFYLIKKNNIYIYFKKYNFFIFLLFYFVIVISSILSDYILLSGKSSIFYIRFGFFYIAVCFFLEKQNHQNKKYIYLLFFFIILLLIDATFQTITEKLTEDGFNLLGQPIQHPSRASSFFGDELVLGSYTVRILPIITAFIFLYNIKKLIKFIPLFWLTALMIVILSSEKTATGLMIISSLVYIFFCNYSLKKKFSFFAILVLLIFSIFQIFPNTKSRLYTEAIKNTQYGKYFFSRVHHSHFITAYNMFKEQPIIGHGPKVFRKKCNDPRYSYDFYSCSTHPHNIYLQLLSETGLAGFIIIFSLWIYTCLRFIKFLFIKGKNSNIVQFKIFTNLGVFLNLFPIATSGNFFNNWMSYIYFLSFALFVYSIKISNSKNE